MSTFDDVVGYVHTDVGSQFNLYGLTDNETRVDYPKNTRSRAALGLAPNKQAKLGIFDLEKFDAKNIVKVGGVLKVTIDGITIPCKFLFDIPAGEGGE